MGIQLPLKGAQPPLFGPCLLWPNVWMDEDATWYGGRHRPRPHCVRLGPSCPKKGHSLQFSDHVYCGQKVAHLSYCWALVSERQPPRSSIFEISEFWRSKESRGSTFVKIRHGTEFRGDRSSRSGDMAILDFSTWRPPPSSILKNFEAARMKKGDVTLQQIAILSMCSCHCRPYTPF